jgi:hypothetical protein
MAASFGLVGIGVGVDDGRRRQRGEGEACEDDECHQRRFGDERRGDVG